MDPRLASSLLAGLTGKRAASRLAPRVLGCRLPPYTLWHSLHIDAILPEKDTDPATTLLVILRICRQRHPMPLPPPGPLARLWQAARTVWLQRHPAALAAGWKAFHAWRSLWTQGPRYWQTRHTRPLKTPWQLYIADRLVRYGGTTWRAALMTPVGLALWRSATLAEAGGGEINIVSEADQRSLVAAGHDLDALFRTP